MTPDTVSSDDSTALLASNEGQTCGVGHRPQRRAYSNVNSTDLPETPVTNKRAAVAAGAAPAAFEDQKSLPATWKSRESIKQAIRLLEAAARQLDLRDSANGALAQAASLLRKQIAPEAQDALGDGRARLLAWQVQKVLTYIDSHIADRVLVVDLSALVRCSEAHFARLFKRTFGESPYAFVVKRRVELAARRMLDTERSLSDIALSCGFSDQAHFSNRFRHVMQDTPSAWRRAQRTEEVRALVSPDEHLPGECA